MGITDKLPGMRPGSTIRNIIVGIVYIFGILFLLGTLMGGAEDTSDGAEPESDGSGEEAEEGQEGGDTSESNGASDESGSESSSDDSGSDSSGSDSSGSDSSEEEDSSSGSYSVRVQYDGEWSGSIAADGSSRSVDGSGEETFEIDGDPTTISANAQKQDDSSEELTIQILQDGEVVAEQSTTAEYGVAQTSYSDF